MSEYLKMIEEENKQLRRALEEERTRRIDTGCITISPEAPDDHWVSPSGSDCWCRVGELKQILKEHADMKRVLQMISEIHYGAFASEAVTLAKIALTGSV